MPRSLKTRKPRTLEVRQLHSALEDHLTARQRRRAEAIVLYAAGVEAAEIARALEVHVNTVYSDLQAFEQFGVASMRQRLRGGAPARISTQQTTAILRLAETPPGDVGLPFGRWSLAKLREYLITRRVVRAISREHLRRLLRKGGCAFGASSASSSATTLAVARSWRESAGSGAICPAEACCCSSTSSRFRSRLTAGAASPRPSGSCWRRRRRRAVFFYLFAAYEVHTGRRRWAFYDGKSSEHVCRFMKQLHRWYRDQQAWVVLDRDSPHPCKSVQTRREMRRLKLHWVTLPKGSPDDNPVETIFSDIQLMVLDNSNDPDVKTTQRRISQHLRRCNRRKNRWIHIPYLHDFHKD